MAAPTDRFAVGALGIRPIPIQPARVLLGGKSRQGFGDSPPILGPSGNFIADYFPEKPKLTACLFVRARVSAREQSSGREMPVR